MVRLTDRPAMTIAVDLGRIATKQTNKTLQTVKTLVKCSIMLHFIWVFTVCKSSCLGVSQIQKVNPCHAVYFYILHSSRICIVFARTTTVVSMQFLSEWKTVWILIRWLHQKSADLDLQCFLNRIKLGSALQGLSFSVSLTHCMLFFCTIFVVFFSPKKTHQNAIQLRSRSGPIHVVC